MRIIHSLITLIIVLTATSFADQTSLVLEPANTDMPTVQKFGADMSRADLGFRLTGVEVETIEQDGAVYHSLAPIGGDLEFYGRTAEEGLPDLPLYAHLIGIPDQSGVRLEIISSSYEILEGYDIIPTQTPVLEGSPENLPFVKNELFYQRDEFYPAEVVELGEPIICRDLRMIQAVIKPFQYNPVTRQLKVYTSIDYNVVFEGTDDRNVKIRRSDQIAESFLPLYRSLVPNAEELLLAYEPIRGGYLILTPDGFADSAAVLGRWKHMKGYDVVIATASDIDPNGSSPTYQEVKTYIQNAYDNWDTPPEYICILGDVDLAIPDYPHNGYTSDHIYSTVDGSDYISDIFVTRMSVPYSFSVLSVAMNKSIKYEKEPYMGDPSYWRRGLSVAGNVYAVTPRITVLWVRAQLMNHGYYQVDTSFSWAGVPGHSDYNPGPGEILASMNNGVSIVSYRGWAGATGWGNPSFGNSNLDQVQNNNKMGIMASIVCGTGAYGYSECFGEKWIRMGSSPSNLKGGPGFYGTTNGNTHTKWNNPIMIGYNWGFLEEGIHNFAAAALRGKINQFNSFPSHNGPGGRIESYHHQYNTLGEPEFEIRTTTPITMTATYPSSIPVGTNMLQVHVTSTFGLPLEGAYVNLLKGYDASEEVFVGGRTDSNGDITLDFSITVADTLFVTVTAVNHRPHLGHSIVANQAVAVGVDAIAIDDDNSGNSSGNNDGNVNPSETIEFGITLKNFGNSTTATNVEATLSSLTPDVVITVPNQSYGDIVPGGSANSGQFGAQFGSSIPQNERIILELDISSDQGSWTAAVPVDIKSMYFLHLGTTYPGNGNGRLDPGETSSLVFELQNIGELAGTSLTGVLSTSSPLINITDNTADFGNIGIGVTGSNGASPFAVEADYTIYNGANVNFNLELTSANGSVSIGTIPVVIGYVASYDPVGPDNYGYYMYDNTDAGYGPFPIYSWTEISPYEGGSGTRINFPDNSDDDAAVIDLPFDFVYYGESFDYMLVCINGFIAFDTSSYDMGGNRWSNSHNLHIPELAAPRGLIGPYWDDLEFSGLNGVFKYYDSANNRFIIEWTGCTHARTGSPQTFQMIIYDPVHYPTPTGDSEILFQYNTINNDDDNSVSEKPGLYSTVGFQNLENDDGLQYTFDNIYHPGAATLSSGRAIKVTTDTGLAPPPEIEYDPDQILTWAEIDEVVTESLFISNIGEGTLVFNLEEIADDRRLIYDEQVEPVTRKNPIGFTERSANKVGDRIEEIYPPVITDFGGPDGFGNRWIDSDESNGPAFSWVDISSVGVEVYPGEDGFTGPHNMGISFPFYENDYSSIYINSNGNLTFSAGSGVYNNSGIPNTADPNNMIAIYWDDLSPQDGAVYYYQDTANDRFIVSFVNVPNWSYGGALNFQAILYPNGQIIFQYGTLNPGNDNLYSNTIGIENSNGTDGLEIAFDNVYVHEQLAIRIYSPVHWMSSNIHGGILGSGEDTIAVITFDATELEERDYTGAIRITCNDPSQSTINIPVTFSVGGGPMCDYIVGDYNGSESFNVADVIAAFSKLKTGAPVASYLCECPFGSGNIWAVAMDLNNSCNFNIADVIAGFSKLKVGFPEPVPCEDCPPGGRRLILGGNDRPQDVPRLKSREKTLKGSSGSF
ncbi:MAG: C25 family cysteine peptidase [candidate division Zixibacteria bacterium]